MSYMPRTWWIGMELNHRRAGLQPTALPIELPIQKLGLTVSIELTTCCLQDSCSAKLSYISNIVGAGAHAHSRV